MTADLTTTLTDGGEFFVCYEADGIRACTFVSSAHLVEDKRTQLVEAVNREAQRAFQ
ncbi:MAG: hypothetical protein ACO29V_09290 [Limnohabitans sp.]